MNVFVLCTGRSGSLTMTRACRHIANYTTGHESRLDCIGRARLDYPENHIEVDNRLSWLLGRLDKAYGNNAYYVHLIRDINQTAQSYNKRWQNRYSLIRAYSHDILMQKKNHFETCRDLWDTVNTNISLFLKDKSHKREIRLENAQEDFSQFWKEIGAEGNLEEALKEFSEKHHAHTEKISRKPIILIRRFLQNVGLSR